jgi:hypothetical protein
MLKIELLAADYGDALLVSWGSRTRPHHLLVDGGTPGSADAVAARVRELAEPIDLLIVTHVDCDHIGGILPLLDEPELAARIQAVWFNGFRQLELASDMEGVLDGERLSTRLTELAIPWNPGWAPAVSATEGGPVVRRHGEPPPVVRLGGRARLTVLSPTPQTLTALLPEWRTAIDKAGLVKGRSPRPDRPEEPHDMLGGSLEDLASLPHEPDRSTTNGSGIAVLFEYSRRRLVLGADAFPAVLAEGLRELAPAGGPLTVDVCKLPHHGSAGNVSPDLVAALDCPVWLLSTSGHRYHHPHPQSLARVIVAAPDGREPVLVGNYASEEWAAFTDDYPPARNGYELHLPAASAPGAVWTVMA